MRTFACDRAYRWPPTYSCVHVSVNMCHPAGVGHTRLKINEPGLPQISKQTVVVTCRKGLTMARGRKKGKGVLEG